MPDGVLHPDETFQKGMRFTDPRFRYLLNVVAGIAYRVEHFSAEGLPFENTPHGIVVGPPEDRGGGSVWPTNIETIELDVYNNPQTYTIPSDRVLMFAVGGGGGGGGRASSGSGQVITDSGSNTQTWGQGGGGGGGGGGCVVALIIGRNGQELSVSIGAGGARGSDDANGTDGGDTDIEASDTSDLDISAKGGKGGTGVGLSGSPVHQGREGGSGGSTTAAGLWMSGFWRLSGLSGEYGSHGLPGASVHTSGINHAGGKGGSAGGFVSTLVTGFGGGGTGHSRGNYSGTDGGDGGVYIIY